MMMRQGPTCVASSNRNYVAEYNHSASVESGSSAEESSSMGLHPISTEAALWEGWTQLKCGSIMDANNSVSSEYPAEHTFPQPDVLSNWILSQSSGSSTPYMDHIRQSSSAHGSYGMLSPTRFTSDTRMPSTSLSSVGPDESLFSESLRAIRNLASSTFHSADPYPHSAAAKTDQRRKAYEGLTQFSSQGSNAIGASHNFLQCPISPESPISPLDLNSVVQQLSNRRHPESAWAEARFQSETCAMQSGREKDLSSNHLTESPRDYSRRANLIPENMSSECYNDYNCRTSTRSVEDISSQSVAYHLDVLGKRNAGTLASDDVNLLAPNFGSSSGWSQFPEIRSTTTSTRLNSMAPSSTRSLGGDAAAPGPSRQHFLQQRQPDPSFSVATTASSILDTSAGGMDQPGGSRTRVNSGKRSEVKKSDDQDSSTGPLSKGRTSENSSTGQKSSTLRRAEPPPFAFAASYSATQTVEVIAAGPALNTNGKPRARRGSATDPQSVYARNRRKRIDERLKTLQGLVPNGAKVDIVTMLDEAFNYVKFLQVQVELLKSDDLWVFATPNRYNDVV